MSVRFGRQPDWRLETDCCHSLERQKSQRNESSPNKADLRKNWTVHRNRSFGDAITCGDSTALAQRKPSFRLDAQLTHQHLPVRWFAWRLAALRVVLRAALFTLLFPWIPAAHVLLSCARIIQCWPEPPLRTGNCLPEHLV